MINEIQKLSLKLAAPNVIKSWSYGEIMKPETINYRTHNPEKDGLFCEVIFGPVKDWSCSSGCGKLKRSKFKGQVCDKCGVEVTKSDVRRKRMGHIELGTPVVHHWFIKTKPYYISTLLDIKKTDLELVIYTEKFIVKNPGTLEFAEKQLIRRKEYEEARRKEKDTIEEMQLEARRKGQEFDINSIERFKAGTGAAIIREMLEMIDLDVMIKELTNEFETATKMADKQKAEKRLRVAEVFRKSGNRPEWMVLTVLPVMPPDLRPMVQLDGGRFASSDINDLYRKVINRNNRYKKLVEMKAPSIIIDNEARLLQEAVDALYNNAKTTKPQEGPNRRKLKSITDQIEKKQGIFRQNLLGKRVDYSGRSVIIAGPTLNLHQCGIPREMAIELFKPMVMRALIEKNLAKNAKSAKRKIESRQEEIWDVLEEVVKGHPVLLNRAPTLHKLSIRAFEPVLIESKAIRLHPLVCSGYNADFDGDQMAVHVPISEEAQAEARLLMLASQNLLHPQNGDSAVTPSQDMILGSYYLTIELKGLEEEGRVFASEQEAIYAYERKEITLHTRIVLDVRNHSKFNGVKYLITTVGKIIFNQIIPNNIPYLNTNKIGEGNSIGSFNRYEEALNFLKDKNQEANKPFAKGFIKKIIGHVYNHVENQRLADMMDDLKDIGFKYATRGGITINLFDIRTSDKKKHVIQESKQKVEQNKELYMWGQITDKERYEAVIDIWNQTTDAISKLAMAELEKDPLNPIWMMMDSGARGSDAQYKQLAGIRGPMADPSGKTIEKAILSNYLEGLSPHEFFISTHGTRKGLADTAIKTASSGYLTRRMVDVAQDVYIAETDCFGDDFMVYREIAGEVENLYDRIIGRHLAKDITDEKGKVMFARDTFITDPIANDIVSMTDAVPVRTVMTCESHVGVCAKCYGMDLSTRKMVEKGEAIGIIAAQSIGEPGTQLTMRTFHTGGIASSGGDITQGLPRIVEIFEARKMEGAKQSKAMLSKVEGTVEIVERSKLKDVLIHEPSGEIAKLDIPVESSLVIKHGEYINVGDQLTKGPIDPNEMLVLRGMEKTKEYILEEVQKVYAKQGVKISDKHIETIVRQMTRKVVIGDTGESNGLIRGAEIDRYQLKKINEGLRKKGKREVEFHEIIKGITTASLDAESFLSRASFQETSRGLVSAAVAGEEDELRGLKETVIIGKMIPSGTGHVDYQKLNKKVKRS